MMKLQLLLTTLLISCTSNSLSIPRGDAAVEVGRLPDSNTSEDVKSDLVLATLDARQIQDAPRVPDGHTELDVGMDGPVIPCKPAGYQYPDNELCWKDIVPYYRCLSYSLPDCKNGYLQCPEGLVFSTICTTLKGWYTQFACSDMYPPFYKEITYCLGNGSNGEPCKGKRVEGYCQKGTFNCPSETVDTSYCLQNYRIESDPWKFDSGNISQDAPVIDAAKDSPPDISSLIIDASTNIPSDAGQGN